VADVKANPTLLAEKIHPEDKERHREAVNRAAENLEPLKFDFRIILPGAAWSGCTPYRSPGSWKMAALYSTP